jgi:hypothetical protein
MNEEDKIQQTNGGHQGKGLSAKAVLLAIAGFFVGIVAGFMLFVSSYPFLGPSTAKYWKVSLVDGLVIAAVGVVAYRFRKKSAFIQGILVSASFMFIVNGLCGISGR